MYSGWSKGRQTGLPVFYAYLSVCLPTYLSSYLPDCLSTYLSVCTQREQPDSSTMLGRPFWEASELALCFGGVASEGGVTRGMGLASRRDSPNCRTLAHVVHRPLCASADRTGADASSRVFSLPRADRPGGGGEGGGGAGAEGGDGLHGGGGGSHTRWGGSPWMG